MGGRLLATINTHVDQSKPFARYPRQPRAVLTATMSAAAYDLVGVLLLDALARRAASKASICATGNGLLK